MLDGIPIANLTAPGLLSIVVVLILIGRIVPRSTLTDKAADSERWRQAYENERAARQKSDEQTAKLLEVVTTTNDIVKAIYSTSERIRRDGAVHADSTET